MNNWEAILDTGLSLGQFSYLYIYSTSTTILYIKCMCSIINIVLFIDVRVGVVY